MTGNKLMKPKKKKVVSFDYDTGEKLEGVLVYCGVKRDPYSKGWIMNSQEALEILAKDKAFTKDSLRILIFLSARLDFENWIQITQKEIAEILEIKKQNVSKAIKLLEEKGIILRGPKIGRAYAFRLNPDFGWKGKVKNLDKYRKDKFDEEQKELKKKVDNDNIEDLESFFDD